MMKKKEEVEIDVRDGKCCGQCSFIETDFGSCNETFCNLHSEYLTTERNDVYRCQQCIDKEMK